MRGLSSNPSVSHLNGEEWQILTNESKVNLARTEFNSGSPIPSGAQSISLQKNNKGIKHIRITIHSNYGNLEYTGLAVVRFTGLPSK